MFSDCPMTISCIWLENAKQTVRTTTDTPIIYIMEAMSSGAIRRGGVPLR